MADSRYETIPTVSTNDIINARYFQRYWNNLDALLRRNAVEHSFAGQSRPASLAYTNATANPALVGAAGSASYNFDFQTSGGNILVFVQVRYSNAAVSGINHYGLVMDGTALGGGTAYANSLMYASDLPDVQQTKQLIWFGTGIPAGSHNIYLVHADNGGGTAETWVSPDTLQFSILEL